MHISRMIENLCIHEDPVLLVSPRLRQGSEFRLNQATVPIIKISCNIRRSVASEKTLARDCVQPTESRHQPPA